MKFQAYAASGPGAELKPFEYDPGELGPDDVQIKVESCGICHSDLSMWQNEWHITVYPFVPGHEVVGVIEETGRHVTHLKAGQRVGAGWYSGSCMTCEWCMSGDQNLCPKAEGIMIGRHGGYADRVRVKAAWAVPLPGGVDPASAGPLFCGGITVFNPIIQFDVKPTDRVGVIGIGGLGHMALQFLRAWGCEVTAFSSNPAKEAEARKFGAHQFASSKDGEALKQRAGSYDFILSTVNAALDWGIYVDLLRPRGRLHFVGVPPAPISLGAFPLISAQKSISGSPLGSPATTAKMLDLAARHHIAPEIETFSFAQVNEALAALQKRQPSHRLVLKH